jgi:hypothetical protein
MKSEGDYLWDRTGEPDPEVQQLEEILGSLRYQPRPLEIPAGIQIGSDRSFFRGSAVRLAIAAAIGVLLLGLGLFLGLQRLQRGQRPELVKTGDAVKPNPAVASHDEQNSSVATSSPEPEQKRTDEPRRYPTNQVLVARNTNRIRNASIRNQQLTAQEQQQAEAAKDQLMLALRVVSVKFGYAQRKTQGLNQKDQIHNQHRIG